MNWLRRKLTEFANRHADAPIRIPAGTHATVTIRVEPNDAPVEIRRTAFFVEHGGTLSLVFDGGSCDFHGTDVFFQEKQP